MGFVGSACNLFALLTALGAFLTPTWLAIRGQGVSIVDVVQSGDFTAGHSVFYGYTILKSDGPVEAILDDDVNREVLLNSFFPFDVDGDNDKSFSTEWVVMQASGGICMLLAIIALALGCREDSGPGRIASLLVALTATLTWVIYFFTEEFKEAKAICEGTDGCEKSPVSYTYGNSIIVYPFFAGYACAVLTSIFALVGAICG